MIPHEAKFFLNSSGPEPPPFLSQLLEVERAKQHCFSWQNAKMPAARLQTSLLSLIIHLDQHMVGNVFLKLLRPASNACLIKSADEVQNRLQVSKLIKVKVGSLTISSLDKTETDIIAQIDFVVRVDTMVLDSGDNTHGSGKQGRMPFLTWYATSYVKLSVTRTTQESDIYNLTLEAQILTYQT